MAIKQQRIQPRPMRHHVPATVAPPIPELTQKMKHLDKQVSSWSLISLGAGAAGLVLGIASVIEAAPVLLCLGVLSGFTGAVVKVVETCATHNRPN